MKKCMWCGEERERCQAGELMNLNEMNPDIRAMRIRKIYEKVKNGESLTTDEERLYRQSKHPRWG